MHWTEFEVDGQALRLLNAFAVALLTLLGAAGEALGYDLHLESNTARRRTHSLFRQGCMLHELVPNMPEPRLRPLIERFAAMLGNQPLFAAVVGDDLNMRGTPDPSWEPIHIILSLAEGHIG